MKKVIELTKIFLKSSFSSFNSQMGIQNGSKKKLPKILYFILFLYLAGVFGFLSYSLIDGLIRNRTRNYFCGYDIIWNN